MLPSFPTLSQHKMMQSIHGIIPMKVKDRSQAFHVYTSMMWTAFCHQKLSSLPTHKENDSAIFLPCLVQADDKVDT